MSELSKTARASMGRQVKEVHVETTEEAIKAIRDNRAAGLHIGDMSRVDKLLANRDEAVQEIVKLQFETGSLGLLRNEELQAALTETEQKLLDVSGAYDAVKDELAALKEIEDGTVTLIKHHENGSHDITTVVMASIPNGELEHADFGHDNTHRHHEGA
jgi:hypothetical protein